MLRKAAFLVALAGFFAASTASAQDFAGFGNTGTGNGLFGIFDEVRLGTLFTLEPDDPSGILISGQIYSRSFVRPFHNYLANTILRPRIQLGGNVSTESDGVSQIYGGLTWDFPVFNLVFLEASFGGTVHNGPLESSGKGLDLGCRLLFHESVGIGVNVGEHWRVIGQADHSSHAHLCPNLANGSRSGNSGVTHAGVYVGYRF